MPLLDPVSRRSLAFLVCSLAAVAYAQTPPPFPVRVDPRVELLSIVFRLAGAEEFNRDLATSAYSRAVDEHFAKWKDHAAVRAAITLRDERSICFDAVPSFAVHLARPGGAEFTVPLDPWPATFGTRWNEATARTFAARLVEFVEDTDFTRFLAGQERFCRLAEDRMRALLAKKPYRAWIEDHFGEPIGAASYVVPGLLEGGGNFGVAVRRENGNLDAHPVIGIWKWDEAGAPVFDDDEVETIVHEFCHPFVNPVVDRHAAKWLPAGERLLARRPEAMAAQAYRSPVTVLYESIVRATVVALFEQHEGAAAADEQTSIELQNGFFFTPRLREALRRFRAERARFPTFASFAGELDAVFADAPAIVEASDAERPRIVAIWPADGATEIGPEATIRIEFDRPMLATSRGVTFADGITVEKRVASTFDASRRVWTVTLRLPANTKVGMNVNRTGLGFCSDRGYALDPVAVSFTTADR